MINMRLSLCARESQVDFVGADVAEVGKVFVNLFVRVAFEHQIVYIEVSKLSRF